MRAEASLQRSCDRAGACVVIPVYNHARTVGQVVRGALEHASTVLVFDDGSTDGSGEEAKKAGATVLKHASNRGKGAALRALLEEANKQGFRHAISLDADGQHPPAELPKLAAAAAEEPGALIIGARDLVAAGAPGSSEFGRKFSNFWVWFEGGAPVEDSQSGFRAYPLPETVRLAARHQRYEFETEVLLRAAWAGVPLRSIPIRVVYPKDRITHFRLFVDNARIVLLNTLICLRLPLPLPLTKRVGAFPHRPGLSLFALRRWAVLGAEGPLGRVLAAVCGILPALPASPAWTMPVVWVACALAGLGAAPAIAASYGFRWLVVRGFSPLLAAGVVLGILLGFGVYEGRRRSGGREPNRWTGRSRGGVFGYWFFFQVTRLFGVSIAYAVLYPIVLYFVLTAGTARRGSIQFLDRVLGPTSWSGRFARTYRHFLSFARTMVDRALLTTRGRELFRCEEDGLDYIRSAADKRGAILLTAHVGNWHVAAGVLGSDIAAKLSIVAFRGERERLARYLERDHGGGPRMIGPRMIEVGSELASLEMVRALREGALLAIQGDRPIDRHVVRVPFLGRDAAFPVGPFVLAAVSGAPLIATFSLQLAPTTYRFFARPPLRLSFERGKDRDTQLRCWVEDYVRELEAIARKYPYQWFNFYDFWNAEPPTLQLPR